MEAAAQWDRDLAGARPRGFICRREPGEGSVVTIGERVREWARRVRVFRRFVALEVGAASTREGLVRTGVVAARCEGLLRTLHACGRCGVVLASAERGVRMERKGLEADGSRGRVVACVWCVGVLEASGWRRERSEREGVEA